MFKKRDGVLETAGFSNEWPQGRGLFVAKNKKI